MHLHDDVDHDVLNNVHTLLHVVPCSYYELSQVGGPLADKIDAADLSTSLTAAITCAILAAAGPQRSRILSALYKVGL